MEKIKVSEIEKLNKYTDSMDILRRFVNVPKSVRDNAIGIYETYCDREAANKVRDVVYHFMSDYQDLVKEEKDIKDYKLSEMLDISFNKILSESENKEKRTFKLLELILFVVFKLKYNDKRFEYSNIDDEYRKFLYKSANLYLEKVFKNNKVFSAAVLECDPFNLDNIFQMYYFIIDEIYEKYFKFDIQADSDEIIEKAFERLETLINYLSYNTQNLSEENKKCILNVIDCAFKEDSYRTNLILDCNIGIEDWEKEVKRAEDIEYYDESLRKKETNVKKDEINALLAKVMSKTSLRRTINEDLIHPFICPTDRETKEIMSDYFLNHNNVTMDQLNSAVKYGVKTNFSNLLEKAHEINDVLHILMRSGFDSSMEIEDEKQDFYIYGYKPIEKEDK